MPRQYVSVSISQLEKKKVVIFTDASEVAIAAVAYIYGKEQSGDSCFLMGKAKVSPQPATSVPCLELCELGVQIAETIRDELDIPSNQFTFFTDSKIIFGYIHNRTKISYLCWQSGSTYSRFFGGCSMGLCTYRSKSC